MASRFPQAALLAFVLVALGISVPLPASSDGVLSDSIAERVVAAWGDRPAGIIVRVNDGVVEMWGEAPSAPAADEAVRIARGTVGVREVISHLDVKTRLEQTRQSLSLL